MSGYEPTKGEILIHKLICYSILSPVYAAYVRSMAIRGHEQILEFGSGSGAMSKHIYKRLGPKGCLACVDISRRWLDIVRNRLGLDSRVEYHLGKIWDLSLSEDRFDIAVIHFVLHDLPRSERVPSMMAIRRCMKPNGTLYIREPDEVGHGMSLDEIETVLVKVGFRIGSSNSRKPFLRSRMNEVIARK